MFLTMMAMVTALPEPVQKMIDAAIASGDAAKVEVVLDLARQTQADHAVEIDAIAATFAAAQAQKAAEAAAQKEEQLRNASFFHHWSGQGELGGFRSTGNTEEAGITIGVKLRREGVNWRHKLAGLVDYRRSNDDITREQFLLSYEPNHKINERLFSYGLAQYERDRPQGFSSRTTLSGGLGYDLIERERMQLSLKGGPAWRHVDFVDNGVEQSLAMLGAVDFSWQITDRLKITEAAESYLESANSTLKSATGVEASLASNLTGRIAYVVEHETAPPAGAVQTDTLTRVTIIYDF
ncbi:DUF481 domain-containing protein [Sphingomicrobium flavum]|uniref:DUF481 domain-containing protein n=1 Tax=Sphingomicrobium flavum TaxID=1229164 RepID=UPI0021ADAC01|nr:DUF481 domain-containing protein [Sphingomicrobium flavum]